MITEVTRRNIFDTLKLDSIRSSGRLEEPDFLSRMYDLNALPSTDFRYKTAYRDIWQHRINNHDWEDDWVFTDSRFDLLRGDDEKGLSSRHAKLAVGAASTLALFIMETHKELSQN